VKEITVTTQDELDALPSKFDEYTRIYIKGGARDNRIAVKVARENSSVEAWENSSVVARGNSSVEAWGNSSVEAWGNSSVVAWENSSVVAWGNSSVVAWGNSSVEARENSSVEAWGNSSVEARENSSVEAWENSSVVAWENSSVEAWGNSSVVAWENSSVVACENSSVVAWENSSVVARGNSSVEARGNSSVVACENSSVVAWGNSSVEARGNSSVEAWGNVGVHLQSDFSNVLLFGFSVLWVLAKGKYVKKSKNAIMIIPEVKDGIEGWFENNAVGDKKKVILYKRVSKDWKTQEGNPWETSWAIGLKLDHPAWEPTKSECEAGKYHACSRPYFCDEFRSTRGDRYIAIEIEREDLYAWPKPSYPHKIAFRRGTVLFECDRHGKKLEAP